MVRVTSPCYVNAIVGVTFGFCSCPFQTIPKTSVFVPEPGISLSIKPKGRETPNFSRALNRLQKEDLAFKVHIGHGSGQVDISVFGFVAS